MDLRKVRHVLIDRWYDLEPGSLHRKSDHFRFRTRDAVGRLVEVAAPQASVRAVRMYVEEQEQELNLDQEREQTKPDREREDA